jgi:hypothetical protein
MLIMCWELDFTSSAKESRSPAILELCDATRVLRVRLHWNISGEMDT